MKFILEERLILAESDVDDLNADENPTKTNPDANTGTGAAQATTSKSTDAKNINWENEYKKCKTDAAKEKFWHGIDFSEPTAPDEASASPLELGYYRSVWGKNAYKISNLGAAFQDTLLRYGWDAKSNIFIRFAAMLLKAPINRVGLLTITSTDFDVLATSFSKGLISNKDLLNEGELQEYNLIFNPNFYTSYVESEQKELLNLQRSFIRTYDADSSVPIKQTFANKFYVEGDHNNLTKNLKPGGVLRKISQIKQLIVPTDIKKAVKDKFIASITDSVTQNKDTALKVFSCAYDAFRVLSPKSIEKLNATTANAAAKIRDEHPGVNGKDTAEIINNTLMLDSQKYTDEQIEELLMTLLKAAGMITS